MKRFLLQWDLVKGFRMLLALLILGHGVYNTDTSGIVFGSIFALMSLFNLGCCAGGQCATPLNRRSTGKTEEISFEEVK